MAALINEINNLGLEKARLAYGKRRASRLFWVKTTRHDLAYKLDEQALSLLISKVEVYDKRWFFMRGIIRLFTGIHKQRELVMYRLLTDVQSILVTSSNPMARVSEIQVKIDKITLLSQRASRFSWFRRTLGDWQGWIKQKLGLSPKAPKVALPEQPQAPVIGHAGAAPALANQPEAVIAGAGIAPMAMVIEEAEPARGSLFDIDDDAAPPPAQPIVMLDTGLALSQFRMKIEEDKRKIASEYNAAYEKIMLQYNTMEERQVAFSECFKDFRKCLKDTYIYYHPDKANEERAKSLGLTKETFSREAAIAFKEIEPVCDYFKNKNAGIKSMVDRDLEFKKKYAEFNAAYEARRSPNSEHNRRIAEWFARYSESVDRCYEECLDYVERVRAYGRRVDALGKKIDEYGVTVAELGKGVGELQKMVSEAKVQERESRALFEQIKEDDRRDMQSIAEEHASIKEMIGVILSTPAFEGFVMPQTKAPLSTNPSTLFAQSAAPSAAIPEEVNRLNNTQATG